MLKMTLSNWFVLQKISTTQLKRQSSDTDSASVRGANPSVANVAKNDHTHDTIVLYG